MRLNICGYRRIICCKPDHEEDENHRMSTRDLNLVVELAGAVLCLLAILHVMISVRGSRSQKWYFLGFYSCLLFYVLSNMGGLLMKGLPGMNWHIGLQITNFCEFFFSNLLPFILSFFLIHLLSDVKEKPYILWFWRISLLLSISMLIVSQFTGLIYYIDNENLYHRGPLYVLYYISAFLIVFSDLYLVVRYRNCLSRKVAVALFIYLIIPLVFAVFQVFFYGPALIIYATLFSAFVMYIFLLSEQTEEHIRQEHEKMVLRLNLLSSQIRPHYIYNVLTSIHLLCRKNPEEAMRVVEHFTDYLRANFEGIAAENPIGFPNELRHIEAYLEVERRRFLDELKVEYRIEHTAFRLPALTVQPIVENAVKHGFGDEEKPLKITISARRCEGASEIVVADNGRGFSEPEISESMEALRNIRERLKLMSNGTLEIFSRKGEGTRVVIRIPDKEYTAGKAR